MLLLLPVCVSLILFPVLGEDEDRRMQVFLSVLAITIQTEILRDKTSRGVPCDLTLSKIAAKLHQVSSTFETLAISGRQLYLNRAEIAASLQVRF